MYKRINLRIKLGWPYLVDFEVAIQSTSFVELLDHLLAVAFALTL